MTSLDVNVHVNVYVNLTPSRLPTSQQQHAAYLPLLQIGHAHAFDGIQVS